MKRILSLAFPLIISQLITMALVLTDVWMMSQLSVSALAAGGLGASVYSLGNYRVYLSSLCAYFVSMSMFGVLFTAIRIKNIALRITLSTFFVALVDVKLFLVLAFLGVKENNLLLNIIFWSSAVKLVAQLILLPPAIWVINLIRDTDEYCFSN
ncbi:VUT family protein [Vibrio pectenicida]|uniref:VUT family protein n=1 Tax=Vibrio pectenicida TaxID=62763 RepID=UPI003B9A8CE4